MFGGTTTRSVEGDYEEMDLGVGIGDVSCPLALALPQVPPEVTVAKLHSTISRTRPLQLQRKYNVLRLHFSLRHR